MSWVRELILALLGGSNVQVNLISMVNLLATATIRCNKPKPMLRVGQVLIFTGLLGVKLAVRRYEGVFQN